MFSSPTTLLAVAFVIATFYPAIIVRTSADAFAFSPHHTRSSRRQRPGFSLNKNRIHVSRGEENDNIDGDDDEPESTSSSSSSSSASSTQSAVNVLGTALQCCCADVGDTGVGTGFYRNGYCSTGEQDVGRHTVCVRVTDQFLQFSKRAGNDLSTPVPQYLFPGLKDGDIWCLCAERWAEAYNFGVAPKLFLQATHEKTLTYVPFDVLRQFALDGDAVDEKLDELNEQRSKLDKLWE